MLEAGEGGQRSGADGRGGLSNRRLTAGAAEL